MSAQPTVIFPIANRMFGVDSRAQSLNALVGNGQIGDWHLGPWTDSGDKTIEIGFDSAADSAVAKNFCRRDTAGLRSRKLVEP